MFPYLAKKRIYKLWVLL